ncbi:AAA family ATPase [Xinfangfangia sp. D13-10-4-6]|uniref:AAA family ATPase n=1 Tax=Pseudogemmobacter hezensis TaxID=2737662 RepID=UPI001556CF7F|nr:toprim domain-containing protein [Pseudogemmobacter hezensis]NPD15767.1 AAA family ATPase [Pseudogemmobacter hezensis]
MTESNGNAGTAISRGEPSSKIAGPIRYLIEVRKLDAVLLEHMGVRADVHPQLGPVIALPYRRDGKPYAGKFRAIEKKDWRSTQGVSRGLFNEDALREGDGPVVITEGEIDALSVIQAGYSRAVSLPDGWTVDGGKRDVLIEAEPLLRTAPYIIVAGDADEAGASLPRTVSNILDGHDVRYVTWPDGCKDANDVLMRFGEGELAGCLADAVQMDPAGGFITSLHDLPPMPERRVLRLGMSPYDHGLAFEVGAMSVGTGTPGAGKSTFTTFAAYHIARHENIRVGLLPFETHSYRIRDQIARLLCRKPFAELTNSELAQVHTFGDRHIRIVHRRYSADVQHHLAWLRANIKILAVRDNCKLIIIDPWNELEHLPEKGESMTAYINFALQQIRSWAEQYDTHICVIAHPRKMSTEGKMKCPTGYDIADSAAFFNKPALGFSVHKDEDGDGDEFVQIMTWKVRETQLYGFSPGNMRLRFHEHGMTYSKFESNARYTSGKASA